MKKRMFLIVMVLVLLLSLAACGTSPSAPIAPKHTLTYLGGEVKTVEPNAGDPHTLVCVYTEYTNNSGETALPADNVNVKAFQHGTEIPIMVFTGTKIGDCIQCDTAVQNGVTAKVIWTFQPQDESEISIELSTGDKYSISGAVADAAPWPITDTPVKLRYDRMWIYGAYAETEDAAMIADIVATVNALTVGEPSDVFVTDYTDILTFTFADGGMLRLEFEEYNWVKNDRERYHVDGLSPLRKLLDTLIEESEAKKDVTAHQIGDRYENTIMTDGIEETIRYEQIRNDTLGFEMGYVYDRFERYSEPDRERFILIGEDREHPEVYLEITRSAEDAETTAATIGEALSKEYGITKGEITLDHAGNCITINADADKNGQMTMDQLQVVYIIPSADGCLVAWGHNTFDSADFFGALYHNMMQTFAVLDA